MVNRASSSAPRPLLAGLALGALVTGLAGLGACSGDECQSPRDCESTELCIAGKCEAKTGGLPGPATPRPDAGLRPDTGVGPSDAGVTPMGDAGTSTTGTSSTTGRDGGVFDAGPLPSVDAGASVDAGQISETTLEDYGLVWIADLANRFGPAYVLGAEFYTNASATHRVRRTDFDLGAEGSCQLRETRLASGQTQGIEAARVEIDHSDSPWHDTPEVLMPRGGGRFERLMPPQTPLLSDNREVRFRIVSNGAVGTLEDAMAARQPPAYPQVQFPAQVGDVFPLLGSDVIRWVPGGGRLTVELYDADREVELICDTPDDGQLDLPREVRLRFALAAPRPPAWMEIRYDEEVVQSVARVGGGMVRTVFRVSRGSKYPLQ